MKETISYQDFDKLDLRVGKVIAASVPEWSEKLIEMKVNFGSEIGEKTILAGVKQWFEPEFFLDKHFAFVVNLAERKMGQGVSQGMMLMVDNGKEPIPFPLPAGVEAGHILR